MTTPTIHRPDVRTIAASVEQEIRALAVGVIANLTPSGAGLSFDYLGIPAPLRGQRIADDAISLACQRADTHRLPIIMQPDSGFGSELPRLVRWYSRHGFVPVPGSSPFQMRRLPA